MGVITISMDSESEKMLREMAKRKYGNRKDAISKTIVESLKSQENKKEEAANRLRAQLTISNTKSKSKTAKTKSKRGGK